MGYLRHDFNLIKIVRILYNLILGWLIFSIYISSLCLHMWKILNTLIWCSIFTILIKLLILTILINLLIEIVQLSLIYK